LLRCDHLLTDCNVGKTRKVLGLLRQYRLASTVIAAAQWRRFQNHKPFDQNFDAKTEYRRASAKAFSIVSILHARGRPEVENEERAKTDAAASAQATADSDDNVDIVDETVAGRPKKKKRGGSVRGRKIGKLWPGFVDPMEAVKAAIGTHYYQMARTQVVGMLGSGSF
jgi:hypothetical protein